VGAGGRQGGQGTRRVIKSRRRNGRATGWAFLNACEEKRAKKRAKLREEEKKKEKGNEEAVFSPSSDYADKNASSSSPKDRTCLPLRFLLLSFSTYFLTRPLSTISALFLQASISFFSFQISDATLGLSSRQLLNGQSPFLIRQSYRSLVDAAVGKSTGS